MTAFAFSFLFTRIVSFICFTPIYHENRSFATKKDTFLIHGNLSGEGGYLIGGSFLCAFLGQLRVDAALQSACDADFIPGVTPGSLLRRPAPEDTGQVICPRAFQRADYLPCILWGRTAQQCAGLAVGSPLALTGRLQSRVYVKQLPDRAEERIAYEISAITAGPAEA